MMAGNINIVINHKLKTDRANNNYDPRKNTDREKGTGN